MGRSVASQVAVKIEYHGDEEADREEVIADELARWWAGAVLRPGAQALVSTWSGALAHFSICHCEGAAAHGILCSSPEACSSSLICFGVRRLA